MLGWFMTLVVFISQWMLSHVQVLLALTHCHLFWFGFWLFFILFPLHVCCFCLFFSFGRILNMHILSYFLIATFSSGLNSCNCWCVSAVHLSSVGLVCFVFILSGIFCLFVFFLFTLIWCFACSSLKPCLILECGFPWFLITSGSGLSLQETQTKRRSVFLLEEHVTTFRLNFPPMVSK